MKKNKKGIDVIVLETIRNSKLITLLLLFIVLGSILLGLLPPLVLEQMINKLTTGQPILLPLAFFYFGLLVLSGVFNALKEILITVFGQKITHRLRSEMCKKLSYLPASYFTQNEAGKTTSRFMNDVDTVEELFTNGIISMFVDVCKVVSIIAVIFTRSVGLGVIILCIAPFLFLMTRQFQKWMLAAQIKNRVAIGKVNNCIPESIRNIRMIHSFCKQDYMERRYDAHIQESYRSMEKSNLYDSIYSPIIILISSITISAVMVLSAMSGGMQEFFGMSVGTAVAVIAYIGQVFSPLESIGMEIQNIQSAIAGVYRICEFLKEPEREITFSSGQTETTDRIELQHVSFGYDANRTVLDNLSFSVHAGENVTLIGRTGAGKSTIFNLLLGLYQPDQGNVRIFGRNADEIPDAEKRKLFGYVEQTFHMVPGTVADQITLFDSSLSSSEVEQAAKLVGLHETIVSLPDGYNTICTETIFSQGQFQLLSIARAVVANPKILLLDEITANLDSVTEQNVYTALKYASDGRTVISISHRLYETMNSKLISIT